MILFLDFDGVTHPVKSNINDIFCRFPLLEDFLVNTQPSWRIVLSTSWREPHSLNELLDFIPESLHHRVLGTTVPDSHPGPGQMDSELNATAQRHAQILYCLQEHYPGEAWLALDDTPEDFLPNTPQLVLCNPATGMLQNTLQELQQRYQLCYNSRITSPTMSV